MTDGLVNHGSTCLAGEDYRHPPHGSLPCFQHQEGSVRSDIGHVFRGICIEELESDGPANRLVACLGNSILNGDNLNEKEGSNPIVLNRNAGRIGHRHLLIVVPVDDLHLPHPFIP